MARDRCRSPPITLNVSTSLEPGDRSETLFQMSVVLLADGSLAEDRRVPQAPAPSHVRDGRRAARPRSSGCRPRNRAAGLADRQGDRRARPIQDSPGSRSRPARCSASRPRARPTWARCRVAPKRNQRRAQSDDQLPPKPIHKNLKGWLPGSRSPARRSWQSHGSAEPGATVSLSRRNRSRRIHERPSRPGVVVRRHVPARGVEPRLPP